MGRLGFVPQRSIFHALPLQHIWWWRNNIFDCYEILVQKADFRWHDSDKACKLDIYGLILGLSLALLLSKSIILATETTI